MKYEKSAFVGAAGAMVLLALLGYRSMERPQDAAPKLGYINSGEIIEQTPGATEAQETFDRELAEYRTEVQTLADSLQAMIARYEQQQIMLSPEKREERQQEILQKRLEYNQRLQELQEKAQQRQQELVQPIYDKISRVLSDIREEQDYTMIFDAAAGALIAADTTLDLTSEVVARLQAEKSAESNEPN